MHIATGQIPYVATDVSKATTSLDMLRCRSKLKKRRIFIVHEGEGRV